MLCCYILFFRQKYQFLKILIQSQLSPFIFTDKRRSYISLPKILQKCTCSFRCILLLFFQSTSKKFGERKEALFSVFTDFSDTFLCVCRKASPEYNAHFVSHMPSLCQTNNPTLNLLPDVRS